MTDDENSYNKSLQAEIARVQAYNKALEEEFAKLDPEDAETHKRVRKEVHELVPDATTTVATLLRHGTSESVRAGLAKWVLDTAMKSGTADKQRDYLDGLFDELKTEAEPASK